tara:strand:- start:168 stop:656 length:489 start_codon:yes stop_codon:yes gene_type:complete
MLMAVTGTPAAEKEYIFTTPLERGLSYKLVNADNPLTRKKLAKCYTRIEHMVEKIKCDDLYTADDLIKRVINKQSDFWISTDGYDNIQGCIIIGFAEMPRGKGINAEAIEGKFDFSIVTPVVEKYYKKLGFKFFEMTGRKGWEKVMEPMGYEFKSITVRKRL